MIFFRSHFVRLMCAGMLLMASCISASASTLHSSVYGISQDTAVAPDSEFSVSVFVDSDRPMNAFAISLSYSPDVVAFLRADTSHSIIGFWQNGTMLLSNGHLQLAGGTSTAFVGTQGRIATLYFKALRVGASGIAFNETSGYLADGTGTKVVIPSSLPTITVDTKGANESFSAQESAIDTTPPQLTLHVVTDPISAKKIVTYSVTNDNSGIQSVEVRSNSWGVWSPWYLVSGPIVYPDGANRIELRVTNSKGISTVQSISVSAVSSRALIVLLACILFAGIAWYLVYTKRRSILNI